RTGMWHRSATVWIDVAVGQDTGLGSIGDCVYSINESVGMFGGLEAGRPMSIGIRSHARSESEAVVVKVIGVIRIIRQVQFPRDSRIPRSERLLFSLCPAF